LITSNGVASYVASTVGAVVLDTLAVVNKVGQAYEGPAAEGSRVPLNGSVLGVFGLSTHQQIYKVRAHRWVFRVGAVSRLVVTSPLQDGHLTLIGCQPTVSGSAPAPTPFRVYMGIWVTTTPQSG